MSKETNTENGKVLKSSHKWYIRAIALALAVIMIVSLILNRQTNLDLSAMQTASFKEEGETIVLDKKAIEEKMKALEEVRELQNKLNDDYQLAMTAIENGQYEDAIEPIRELLDNIEEGDVSVYLTATLAELYYATGDYENCAETCDKIVADDHDSEGTYQFMAGVCRVQTGNLEQCIQDLQAALDAGYPEVGICKAQIAIAAINLGNYELAASAGKAALEAEHDDSLNQVLHYICAISNLQTASYEDAIENLNVLLEEDTENVEYLYYRGIAGMALEHYADAAADLQEAMNLGYDDIGCLYNYGICAIMSEDYENGMNALQTVIDRNENEEYTKSSQELLDQIYAAAEEAAAAEQAGTTAETAE